MEQQKALELAKQGYNLFITGKAGTGKTFLLNEIIIALKKQGKVVAKTASTGVAATHINGRTLHSWAKLGMKQKISDDDLYKAANNKWDSKRIKKTDVIVIDEISMLHMDAFESAELMVRFISGKDEVFGGKQVILCGDFFQLPPVDTQSLDDKYSYLSQAWTLLDLKTCYLDKIYRQNDAELIDLLNCLRANEIKDRHHALLQSFSKNTKYVDFGVNLFPTNKLVDGRNEEELAKLKGDMYEYTPVTWSKNDQLQFLVKTLLDTMPVDNPLQLKLHAKVMITVNDRISEDNPEYRYINGTIGYVLELPGIDGTMKVKIMNSDRVVTLERNKWVKEEYNSYSGKDEIIASVSQYPIKLAWAMTVHKSQGCSFDYVNIDLENAFVENLGYVALSRATTMEGINLKGYNQRALQIKKEILKKDKEFLQESKENESL